MGAPARPRIADDLGSLAGRLAKIGTDAKDLKPRLDLRQSAAAETYAGALSAISSALNALRWLEVREQGGVAAPAAPGRTPSATRRSER